MEISSTLLLLYLEPQNTKILENTVLALVLQSVKITLTLGVFCFELPSYTRMLTEDDRAS